MECAGVVKDFAYFSQRRILNCYNTPAPYELYTTEKIHALLLKNKTRGKNILVVKGK